MTPPVTVHIAIFLFFSLSSSVTAVLTPPYSTIHTAQTCIRLICVTLLIIGPSTLTAISPAIPATADITSACRLTIFLVSFHMSHPVPINKTAITAALTTAESITFVTILPSSFPDSFQTVRVASAVISAADVTSSRNTSLIHALYPVAIAPKIIDG